MGRTISRIFSPPSPRPAPAPPAEPEPVVETPVAEKKGKKAQLLALKATGASGLLGEGNIARKKILV